MDIPAPKPARRIGLTIWMIFSQLVSIAAILIWLALSILPLAFWDDPNAPLSQQAAILWFMWLSPLIPIGLSIAAWIAYAFRKNWQAFVLSAITSVPPLLIVIFISVSSLLDKLFLPTR